MNVPERNRKAVIAAVSNNGLGAKEHKGKTHQWLSPSRRSMFIKLHEVMTSRR